MGDKGDQDDVGDQGDQGEVFTIILGMPESLGLLKYSTHVMFQLFSLCLCLCHFVIL